MNTKIGTSRFAARGLASSNFRRKTLSRKWQLWSAVLTAVCSFLVHSSPVSAQTAITALTFTPDNKGFIQASQTGVAFHNLNMKQRQIIPTKLDHVHDLAFSPNGKTLAVAGGFPAEKGVVELWSWPALKLLGHLEGHSDVVYDVEWLKDGQRLAAASADRTVSIWNIAKREKTATLKGHSGPVLALTATPDGKWLCSASADHTIRVWKTANGELVRALTNHLGPVRHLAFRPPGSPSPFPYLASASDDKTVRIWQPTIGRLVRIVRYDAPATAVAWSKKGDRVYSAAEDGKLRTIDGDSDEIISTESLSKRRLLTLSVSTDGQRILTGDAAGEIYQIESATSRKTP